MNLKKEERELLAETKNASEWNDVCDMIKKDRGGQYPPDWFAKVMLSGFFQNVESRWDEPNSLRADVFDSETQQRNPLK